MQNRSEQRQLLINHLEAAIRIADDIDQPITAYLIERALDGARDVAWTR